MPRASVSRTPSTRCASHWREERGGEGDRKARREQHETVGPRESGEEPPAGARADAGEEEDEPDLAERDARAEGQAPDHGTRPLHRAEHERHDERSAREPERDRDAARQRDRRDPEEQAERQPEAERQDVHLARGAVGVAEVVRRDGELVDGPEDADPIAHLEAQLVVGEQVHVPAPHAGDDDAERSREVELPKRPAGDLRVRHEDAPHVELAPIEVDALLGDLAEALHHPVELALAAHRRHEIPGHEPRVGSREQERLAAADPPEDDAPAESAQELLDRERSHVLSHPDRRGRERLVRGAHLREPLPLRGEVRLPAPPRHADREHDPDDAHRIADRVRDHRLRDGAVGSRLLERLDRCGQRRRVREGAREQPRRDGGVEPQRALRHRGERGRERHGRHCERRGADPISPQGGDERAAGGEPHRVDEDGEPEHVDDLGEGERRVERARGESDEEDRRHSEAAAADVEPAERITDRGDEEQEQQRVRCEDPDERVCHAAARIYRGHDTGARAACGAPSGRLVLRAEVDAGGVDVEVAQEPEVVLAEPRTVTCRGRVASAWARNATPKSWNSRTWVRSRTTGRRRRRS
jgi:hypothetical protein